MPVVVRSVTIGFHLEALGTDRDAVIAKGESIFIRKLIIRRKGAEGMTHMSYFWHYGVN